MGLVPGAGDAAQKVLSKAKKLFQEGKVAESADLVEGLTKGVKTVALQKDLFLQKELGLIFEEKVKNKAGGYVDVELSARQKFDKSGVVVDSKFAQSDLVARYSPDGNLYIDWYGTTVSGKGVGSEMISRAIEAVGANKVKTVSAQLGKDNLDAFKAGSSRGLSRSRQYGILH